MNDETKVPFFINTKRRQSAESYFEIGRTQDKLRKLLEQKRNSNVIVLNDEDWEEYGKVGCYGVSRFIKLDDEGGEGDGDDFVDEDVHYANTNSFQLFWMTFKNIASSIGQYFSSTSIHQLTFPKYSCNDNSNNLLCHHRSSSYPLDLMGESLVYNLLHQKMRGRVI